MDEQTMREAVIYGNVLGSFTVEEFGIDRLINLTMEAVNERYRKYREMVIF
jgi:hypothetical protein